jgi:hypothetical protein
MMAEFQRVDIKKYLRTPRKPLDKTDKTPQTEVLSVLSSDFQGKPVEKKYQEERPGTALTLEDVLKIIPAAGPVEWTPNAVAEKAKAKL